MMFLLAYIGAPPTIGMPAAMAPPATAKATTAAVLSNLIFITAPSVTAAGPRVVLSQCGEHVRYAADCRSDATACIQIRTQGVSFIAMDRIAALSSVGVLIEAV